MKCLTLPNPWASLVVWGGCEIINQPRLTRHRGPVLIHAAHTPDARAMSEPALQRIQGIIGSFHAGLRYARRDGQLLGVVEIIDATAPDETQLPFAHGPACWRVGYPQVFLAPVAERGWFRMAEYTHPRLSAALESARTPAAAAAWFEQQARQGHRETPSPDGWTGD